MGRSGAGEGFDEKEYIISRRKSHHSHPKTDDNKWGCRGESFDEKVSLGRRL